jgi:hypothetical protein
VFNLNVVVQLRHGWEYKLQASLSALIALVHDLLLLLHPTSTVLHVLLDLFDALKDIATGGTLEHLVGATSHILNIRIWFITWSWYSTLHLLASPEGSV